MTDKHACSAKDYARIQEFINTAKLKRNIGDLATENSALNNASKQIEFCNGGTDSAQAKEIDSMLQKVKTDTGTKTIDTGSQQIYAKITDGTILNTVVKVNDGINRLLAKNLLPSVGDETLSAVTDQTQIHDLRKNWIAAITILEELNIDLSG